MPACPAPSRALRFVTGSQPVALVARELGCRDVVPPLAQSLKCDRFPDHSSPKRTLGFGRGARAGVPQTTASMQPFATVFSMRSDLAENYRVRLRSLQWASALLKDLSHSEDAEAVLVATNWALDSVYDLAEGYWVLAGLTDLSVANEDEHLSSRTPKTGEKVGGLLVARGKKTHQLMRLGAPSPYKNLPYDFADLTDWVWAEPTWPADDRLATRTEWYRQQISGRPLWNAVDQAEYWFLDNSPVVIPRREADSAGWVAGVSPNYL